MFTIHQITAAHSRVRSGADFPSYIQKIKELGVRHYDAFVADGHINYYGADNHIAKSPPKYAPLEVALKPRISDFMLGLKAHQEGKSDYLTFIHLCAQLGIDKWQVRMDVMTCTYFDREGNIILEEAIPQ
ncbi:DUF1398 domain-containing protein [Dyadobacter tibetensis]|uniref:DUF1398 domain-containing protein n=1 Tax=Dyadobacter tibetensis TaxID=1211851 RepID=UPI00047103BC|nr:DUF1398 family protein [Dyadobacter tibetensis]